MKRVLLSIVIALSVATPARADWQFARWGMTQENFLKNSPIPIRTNALSSQCVGSQLESDWKAGELDFTACFGFDLQSKTLNQVNLYLEDYAERGILHDALINRYGEAKVNTGLKEIGVVMYEWRYQNTLIMMVDSRADIHKPQVYIDYRSLQENLEMESKL